MAKYYSSDELKKNFGKDIIFEFVNKENYENFEDLLLNVLYIVRERRNDAGEFRYKMPNPAFGSGNVQWPLEILLLEYAGYIETSTIGEYDPAVDLQFLVKVIVTEQITTQTTRAGKTVAVFTCRRLLQHGRLELIFKYLG